MPNVLAIAPGTPRAMEGRTLLSERLTIELAAKADSALAAAATSIYDLLVLVDMSVDEQQAVVSQFQQHRRWRLVPVLHVLGDSTAGVAIPGTYRPEIDGIVRGTLASPQVQRRILSLAREGVAEADLVVAGPYEFDPVRGRLRCAEGEVAFTDREADILAILLSQPNRTVSAGEIIERGWGTEADARYQQILRRHVSNIRRKLHATEAARSVRTVRGAGYRFEIKLAS
ncbi:MAG: hypothetical protein C0506_12405 [Anaerolinea sp.]|nr:hypothetical protein [Anaerolinea sp.]